MRHAFVYVMAWIVLYIWWRHQMEAFSALLAICAGNSPVTGELSTQRPATRGFDVFHVTGLLRNKPVTGDFPAQWPLMSSFDVFFDLRPNKRLSKQSWGWWFETPSCPLWRHSYVSFTGTGAVDYYSGTRLDTIIVAAEPPALVVGHNYWV